MRSSCLVEVQPVGPGSSGPERRSTDACSNAQPCTIRLRNSANTRGFQHSDMDEILKSEIFITVYGKSDGVSFEEFGGLFRQVHGYNLRLSHYGYTSMRKLLNDMNNLVEVKTINGEERIRCKSPSKHHVVVSNRKTLPQAKERLSGRSRAPVPSPGQPSGGAQHAAHAAPAPQQTAVTVRSTNPATGSKSKGTSKSPSCHPAKIPNPAVKHTTCLKPGLSSRLNPAPSSPVPAAAAAFPKTKKDSNTKQKKTSTFLNPYSGPIMPHLPYVISAKGAASGPSKKPGLLPTPNPSLRGSPFLTNYIPLAAQPGIRPSMSYASACKSNLNVNQRHHSSQQCPPNNVRFMVDPRGNASNVPQSSRAEHRPPIQSSTVIKENIGQLLNQHDNGLSIFQLQKLYLMKFQQPLRFRGSTTLKHLLAGLTDVVKMEGLGVQMLVYPVTAEGNLRAPAPGDQGAAVSSLTKASQKDVLVKRCSADSFQSQKGELRESAPLSLRDDHILVPGLTTPNGLKQNASQESTLPQIILHSSGFSFVMEQRIHDPHNKLSEMTSPHNPGSRNQHEPPSHGTLFPDPGHLQQTLPSALLPGANPPKSLVSQVENMEHGRLQSPDKRNETGSRVQEASPASQTSGNSQTENCSTSEYLALPSRGKPKPKPVLPKEPPPAKRENTAQDKKCEKVVPSNGRGVQTREVVEKASQDDASVSQPINDPTKTGDSYVPGSEQSAPMASELQKTVNIQPSKSNPNKQKLQAEKYPDPEEFVQPSILSSQPKQEFVLYPQNAPVRHEVSVEQSNQEMPDHEYKPTWQTSQGQVCCIL